MTRVLFRCDGSHEIGLGHVVRCLSLAEELKTVHGCRIAFAMWKSKLGIKMVEDNFEVYTPDGINEKFDHEEWLLKTLQITKSGVLILDVRDGMDPSVLKTIKQKNVFVVDIDDPEEKRLEADLVFYPPVPQVNEMSWENFKGTVFAGWEWVILREEYACLGKNGAIENETPVILVAMGGSDPGKMTLKVIDALSRITAKVSVQVVLGQGCRQEKDLDGLLADFPHPIRILKNVKHMAPVMAEADIAVAAFGVTAYELGAMGIPAYYLCLTEDHLKSADIFVKSGLSFGASLNEKIDTDGLVKILHTMIQGNNLNKKKIRKCNLPIDGHGGKRVAQTIISEISSR
jgi:spore coat polysaccharide biosynthesis predicted glycosyltransferase SpsG